MSTVAVEIWPSSFFMSAGDGRVWSVSLIEPLEPRYPLSTGLGGSQRHSGAYVRRQKVACTGKGTPDGPARILVTIPTRPFWLLFSREIFFSQRIPEAGNTKGSGGVEI